MTGQIRLVAENGTVSNKVSSKDPRAEHVALSEPPIGGLNACPHRRQAELVPQM